MKPGVAVVVGLLVAAPAFAQGNRGSITGTVSGPDGLVVAGATVQAINVSSGAVSEAQSSKAGTYEVPDLVPGSYELSVPVIGFTFLPYSKKDLAVQAGQTSRVDVRLEWSTNLGTIGDDIFLTVRNRYANLTGPTPRTADGKPDLSGNWNGSADLGREESVALPWAAQVKNQRLETNFKGAPSGFCLPAEVVPSSPVIYQIVQTPSLLVQLFEDVPSHRLVFLDGRSHPSEPEPSWRGHSVGRWDGDTLVIDTVGLNGKSWLPDGLPHTEMLHVIERYRRTDFAHLVIDITFEDPGALSKPWNLHTTWALAPGEELIEYVCTENNRYTEPAVAK